MPSEPSQCPLAINGQACPCEVRRLALESAGPNAVPQPAMRDLRVYAFDPQSSTSIDTAGINVATIALPWERWFERPLEPGPCNEYLEVIDVDPVSGQLYEPIDLNSPHVLARDGLDPSEGDPRFHQQMVFAVAMKTIRSFERALGRRISWSPRWDSDKDNGVFPDTLKPRPRGGYVPVDRLRVYPHALREANAYYSRDRKALLFGYFPANTEDASATWVFSALSHDIIAHETTHAILDGLHRRYAEATNIDSLAFHEAFGDIVALLSHFTLGDAVREFILRSGGNLNQRNLMSGLARQFGNAQGRNGSLREAIDRIDPLDKKVDTATLASTTEPHARGAILVAAVFEAFLTIYSQRTVDLMRIAGINPDRAGPGTTINSELATRLAREASKSADHVLRMCLRALDYLPPVDVRFGEFLRAIITADSDLVAVDRFHYRLAMIEAFRRRGIFPENTLSLAPDSLRWESPDTPIEVDALPAAMDLVHRFHCRAASDLISEQYRMDVHSFVKATVAKADKATIETWQDAAGVLLHEDHVPAWLDPAMLNSVMAWPDRDGGTTPTRGCKVEIHSVRTALRLGPDGETERLLIIEITQRRRGFFDDATQRHEETADNPAPEDFVFRGGATLIFDLNTRRLRYSIRKSVHNAQRLAEQRAFLAENPQFAVRSHYDGSNAGEGMNEPFAFVHREG